MKRWLQSFSAMVVCVFVVYGGLSCVFFVPSYRKQQRFKKELVELENKMETIRETIGGETSLHIGLNNLQTKMKLLQERFPRKEEGCLRVISDIARKGNVEVISIQPQERKVLRNEKKKEVTIEGEVIRKVTISLQLRAYYKDFIVYLETLGKELPAYVSMDSVVVASTREDEPLTILLQGTLYLLG